VEEGTVVEERASMEATGGKERATVTGGMHPWLHTSPRATPAAVHCRRESE
jgi:hypothetical protein